MKNYHEELNKLKEHRRLYMPAIEKILGMYSESKNSPREITDEQNLPVILELIDIGYIDRNEVRVKSHNGVVERVVYTGAYPLTDAGIIFMKDELRALRSGHVKKIAILAALLLLCAILLIIISM